MKARIPLHCSRKRVRGFAACAGRLPHGLGAAAVPLLSACAGAQSALAPAGVEAERVAQLFWVMAAAAALIWLGVLLLALLAARSRPRAASTGRATRWLAGIGLLLPLLLLTPLLVWSLMLLAELRPAAAALRIDVTGERWWWRVHYRGADGRPIAVANEIRLPVDQAAAFSLRSADVIHSFWIPALGGKMDLVPGRTTELVLQPTRSGRFNGVCAEYCGSAHAQMGFVVEVMEAAAFERWLALQAAPAAMPVDALAAEGAAQFQRNGCGACHAVRGTAARGSIGPDLTHVGSRLSLAAGELPNDAAALAHWLARPARVKPGVLMPRFDHIPEAERAAIAAYLGALQ